MPPRMEINLWSTTLALQLARGGSGRHHITLHLSTSHLRFISAGFIGNLSFTHIFYQGLMLNMYSTSREREFQQDVQNLNVPGRRNNVLQKQIHLLITIPIILVHLCDTITFGIISLPNYQLLASVMASDASASNSNSHCLVSSDVLVIALD